MQIFAGTVEHVFLGAGYFGVAMKVAIDFRVNKEQLEFSGVAHIDLLVSGYPGVSELRTTAAELG